ncbi:MAG: hypothetical protein MK089_12205, partial [Phycisphaerales bacterium]|nr:hypothetical protein [Phycisphaerales bacterium]
MRTLLVSVVVMTCAVAAHAAPKKVLFKQFTATWSGYDPSVSEGLYSVIQANPQTTCAIQIHGGDNYVTPLGNTLINFYDVDGYPTVWLDGMWLQYGSTGSPEENEASLLELLNGASFTTDVTIEVTGETVGENEYALSVTLGIEDGGETRDMKLYITQVYDDVSWPEPGEFQMNTLRQAASPQTVTLAPGESQTYAHTFTLENESLNTNFVNYIVWAQENSDSAP